jgi:hypothetical protein
VFVHVDALSQAATALSLVSNLRAASALVETDVELGYLPLLGNLLIGYGDHKFTCGVQASHG